MAIIARSIESPRGDIRGGLFVCLSPFGRRPHVTTPHPPHLACASGASRRPSFNQHVTGRCARTRRPCGEPLRRMRPLRLRDTVRAGNDRTRSNTTDLPLLSFLETPVTAYLISLALAGLVAIVMWDSFE